MDFRTELHLQFSAFKMQADAKVLTIGSCFSDVLGQQLQDNKINCMVNPYGTVFNPYSIFKILTQAIQQHPVSNHLFVETPDKIWHHYDYHSQFWANTKETLQATLNDTHLKVGAHLKKVDYLFITFGTVFLYQLKENSQAVSNCHKMPSRLFKREMMSQQEIQRRFDVFYASIKQYNPKIRIILSLSPVRHTRDTLPLNSLSKALLRVACHQMEEQYSDVFYFPSYEIMMDDLRDYRFYKIDLIHPSEMAEQYIFEKFAETYFHDDLKTFIKDWAKIRLGLMHRPQVETSETHQRFLHDLLIKLEAIDPRINVSDEIKFIKSKLVT